MIDAITAKLYAERFNRTKTLEDVMLELDQNIVDNSLNGKYDCNYPIIHSNRGAVTKNSTFIKKELNKLGYFVKFVDDNDIRGYHEIKSIIINWNLEI